MALDTSQRQIVKKGFFAVTLMGCQITFEQILIKWKILCQNLVFIVTCLSLVDI